MHCLTNQALQTRKFEVEQFCGMAVWHVFLNNWFGIWIDFLQTKQTKKETWLTPTLFEKKTVEIVLENEN